MNIIELLMDWNKIYNLIIILLVLFVFVGCSGKKLIVYKNEEIKKIKHVRSAKRLYKRVETESLKYSTLLIRFSTEIEEGDESRSFNGSLRIKKDSIVWVSVRPALGIEAVRVKCTPDSVYYMNKLNHTYFAGDYSYLSEALMLDLDYTLLENLLVNQIFTYPHGEKDINEEIKRYKTGVDSLFLTLSSIKEKKVDRIVDRKKKKNKDLDIVFHEILVDPQIMKVSKVNIEDYRNERKAGIEYFDFYKQDEQVIPSKIEVSVSDQSKEYRFNIEYNKVVFDKNISFKFEITDKYKPVEQL